MLEDVQRGTELLPCQHPVPGPPQALAVGQPGPGGFERQFQGLRVLAYCLIEQCGEIGVCGQQALAAQRPRERPRLPLRLRRGGEMGGSLLGGLLAAESEVGLGGVPPRVTGRRR